MDIQKMHATWESCHIPKPHPALTTSETTGGWPLASDVCRWQKEGAECRTGWVVWSHSLALPDFDSPEGETLMHDHEKKAILQVWVITPNPVHHLFTQMAPIEKLMQSWKGVSARRSGLDRIWPKNYRDSLISDATHFANAVRSIRRNPVKFREETFT